MLEIVQLPFVVLLPWQECERFGDSSARSFEFFGFRVRLPV